MANDVKAERLFRVFDSVYHVRPVDKECGHQGIDTEFCAREPLSPFIEYSHYSVYSAADGLVASEVCYSINLGLFKMGVCSGFADTVSAFPLARNGYSSSTEYKFKTQI